MSQLQTPSKHLSRTTNSSDSAGLNVWFIPEGKGLGKVLADGNTELVAEDKYQL